MRPQTKRKLDLRILVRGNVHLATGIELSHSQLRPWLDKHYESWTLASYQFTDNHNQVRTGEIYNGN